MKFRAPFDYDVKAASDEAVAPYDPVSVTVQEHSIDADINVIAKRYGLTGTLPVNQRVPEFGDYTQVSDYRSALEAVHAGYEHFMEFPAEVRSRFNNDPQMLLEFCANPANLDAMREMGLAVPKVVTNVSSGGESTAAPAAAN